MSDFLERISKLSPKRLALLAVELNESLDQLKQQSAEPLAVIGLGCRFPGGADDADSFWRLIEEGRDAIRDVPADRWDVDALYDPDPEAPGKMSTRWGGFLDKIDTFDPEFFGISPREAAGMDPQQRILLEVAWEALENAGQSPEKLAGSSTGVFAGICSGDYSLLRLARGAGSIDAYVATGNAHSVASGRISYLLGLHGPSVSIDTACSSSLVAVHLACQSLRAGECRMVLAGGVNLVLVPDTTITLSKSHMMSPVGRCKAFDASADGFVRAEGAGLVVIKRLSDAIADGDAILALIRGSASNQDGASAGLTAPNGPAQEAVIREALARAQLTPADIEYIEAHGTGTSLGDPIEARALAHVFGADRPVAAPLRVGSVKTNIGHAESAAGIAGLIKVVLALQRGRIPKSLHLTKLNPLIDWTGLPLEVASEAKPWNRPPGSRMAGVSSFGFSGTNAHIVLSDYVPEPAPAPAPGPRLLPLSARSEAALRELVARYSQAVDRWPEADFAAICHSAGAGRSHFEHRLAVQADGIASLRAVLAAAARGEEHPAVRHGSTGNAPVPGVVFMFTGQGAQYAGMGRELYEREPVFRRELDRCAEILGPILDRPLLDIIFSGDAPAAAQAAIDQTQYTQPALFAVEYALAALWRSWGIEPAAVLGHSVGEYVAACVAGVFSLEDGLRLIAARGKLMGSLPSGGGMLAVMADEARVSAAIGRRADRVSVACLNGPANVVLAGDTVALDEISRELAAAGVKSRSLAVSHAFHSPLMEPILGAFEATARTVTFAEPAIALVSNVTGSLAAPGELAHAAYWRRHIRQPVRFADSIRGLRTSGQTVFLEIGPHPVLTGMARQTADGPELTWASSLRRGTGELAALLDGLATLYVRGVAVDWAAVGVPGTLRRVPLPTYPFQRARYWVEPGPACAPARQTTRSPGSHPLLGTRFESPAVPGAVFEVEMGADRPAFLNDHRIFGRLIMPSPAYIEAAVAALAEAAGVPRESSVPCEVSSLAVLEPLFLPEEDGAVRIQVILEEVSAAGSAFRVCGKDAGDPGGPWRTHASGRVSLGARVAAQAPAAWDRAAALQGCEAETDAGTFYEAISALGLEFGERFRGLTCIWRGRHCAVGELRLPASLAQEAGAYRIHPALLDACFHLLGAALPDDGQASAYLLIAIERFSLLSMPPARLWNHTQLRASTDGNREALTGDIRLYDDAGGLVAEVTGLQLRRASREAMARAGGAVREDTWFHELQWREQSLPVSATAGTGPADFMPAPAELGGATRAQAVAFGREMQVEVYDELVPALEALSGRFVLRAFSRLGWKPAPGQRVDSRALQKELGIVGTQARLFDRLLAILGEEDILARDGDSWQVRKGLRDVGDLQAEAEALRTRFPACRAEVTLVARCADRLDEALTGRADPLQLLFPNGDFSVADDLYRRSPFARALNSAARFAVMEAVGRAPAGRTVRILEIGAGTGGTTSFILPHLPGDRVRYTFSDISPLFLSRAREEFSRCSWADYAVLDIEKDPAAQPFDGRDFDLIIAANVIHATRDIRATMLHASSLLAPGGVMILLEGTAPRRWVDLTFGLTDGWWRFDDADLRPDYPLISRDAWTRLLDDIGFDAVPIAVSDDLDTAVAHQAIIVARKRTAAALAGTPRGTWIATTDGGGVADALSQQLTSRGEACVLVGADAPEKLTQALVQARAGSAGPLLGVIHLGGLDGPVSENTTAGEWEARQNRLGALALRLAREAAGSAPSALVPPAKLWLVSRGGQHVPAAPANLDPLQATTWGLARGFSLEFPIQFSAVIDLDPRSSAAESARGIAAELAGASSEDGVVLRGGRRFVPRVVRSAEPPTAVPDLRKDAAYLVTGGLGGVGLHVGRWLAAHGAGCVVLLTRRTLPDRATWSSLAAADPLHRIIHGIQEMESLGARVVVAQADVSDEVAMTALAARFGSELPALRGVLHAAVDMSGAGLATLEPDQFAAMCRAKSKGAWILHRLTRTVALDFFVLFSSTTSLWGAAGLAHYAAANQALDVLAHHRRSLGLPALVINWGTWQEMRVASDAERERFAQAGLQPMDSSKALAALGRLIAAGWTSAVVASVDWPTLRSVYEARRERPLFAELRTRPTSASPAPETKKSTGEPSVMIQLKAASPNRRRELLIAHLRAQAGAVLGFNASREIPLDQGLFDMGMDSLMSVELKGRLERSLGVPLPSTLTFNYPTLGALAEFLLKDVLTFAPPAEPPAPAAAGTPAPAPTPPTDSSADDLDEEDLERLLLRKIQHLQ